MIDIPSLKDVREAWEAYARLPVPYINRDNVTGSPKHVYEAREAAWKEYTKVRDHYLYSVKAISLKELNQKWYPRESGYNSSKHMN